MRIALISDIHANLPALQAVVEDIDGGGIDAIYHLGDLVGYAPWPNEVVALIRERGISGVAGNYDSTVATDHESCGCRYEDPRQEKLSHLSYEWTRANCNERTKAFLATLPFRLDMRPLGGHSSGPKLVLVHGTPTRNTLYWTEDRSDDFCRQMAGRAGAEEGDLIAFGHTHKPWHRVIDGIHFVNAGSVGRPKDGDWRAGYVVVEPPADHARESGGDARSSPSSEEGSATGFTVSFERVEYDLESAMNGVLASDLPDDFAYYLESGGKSLGPAESSNA